MCPISGSVKTNTAKKPGKTDHCLKGRILHQGNRISGFKFKTVNPKAKQGFYPDLVKETRPLRL